MKAAAAAHPGKRIALWFMDEARVGQKGRLCHRWWSRGRRPPGRCDGRFGWVYLFAAVEPATGRNVALVLPEATTTTMNLFLAEFAAGLPEDVHAVLVLDGAGWHGAHALVVPANVTLVPLPPYSPELLPSYQLKSGDVLEVSRAAFRGSGQWYDLDFRCEVDAEATKVVAFALRVGDPLSSDERARRGLPSQ